jgi:hypothetical protein
MTDDKIALRELLEKGSDTTFLREMIGFAAEQEASVRPLPCLCRLRNRPTPSGARPLPSRKSRRLRLLVDCGEFRTSESLS